METIFVIKKNNSVLLIPSLGHTKIRFLKYLKISLIIKFLKAVSTNTAIKLNLI